MILEHPGDAFARDTYDRYATAYDDANEGYMYERWTGRLLAAAEDAGLSGDRLLDVGCGTGLSFLPMLERGWQVTACDISPAMLDLARGKVTEKEVVLAVEDMRQLPVMGAFDLVWAVNDAINYLLDEDELVATLQGMGRNLAPAGIGVFDVNTLRTYRTFFSAHRAFEANGRRFAWRGLMEAAEIEPGSVSEAVFEEEGQPDLTHVHRQRHFGRSDVERALDTAGLECLDILGELGGSLSKTFDEEMHTKAVYVCSRQ